LQTSLKTKAGPDQQPRDVVESAEDRRRAGERIARRLSRAGELRASPVTLRRAVLVARCADPSNVWATRDVLGKDGRSFDPFGTLWACSCRMCPFCLKQMQGRAQRRLVEKRDAFWRAHKPERGKFERFVTLTGPTLQGVSQQDTDRIYNRAFRLLSGRAFWEKRVDAGAKHVEFTVNERGYHTHIHLMIYGRFMERDAKQEAKSKAWRAERVAEQEARRRAGKLSVVKEDLMPLGNLQDEWTSCLSEAASESSKNVARAAREIEWSVPYHETLNYDQLFMAHVLGSYCLLETKNEVRPLVIAEKDGVYSRFPMIGGKGIEVQPTPAAKANVHVCFVREKGRPSDNEISLHSAVKELTKYITKSSSWSEVSDEQLVEIAEVRRWPRCFELLKGWRKKPETKEQKAAREAEEAQRAADESAMRAKAVATINAGETWELFCQRVQSEGYSPDSYVIAWDILNATGTLYVATSGDIASLDTGSISPAEESAGDGSPPEPMRSRARLPSLMALGDVLSADEWLKTVALRVVSARRVRRGMLARWQPNHIFDVLDGTLFRGVLVRKAEVHERIDRFSDYQPRVRRCA
jgi:hypothetical protein